MTDVTAANPQKDLGVLSRFFGVILSPKDTYAVVAAKPRVLGILVLSLGLMIAVQAAFLSTDVGKNAMIDQQIAGMRAFGQEPTDEIVQRLEQQSAFAPYIQGGSIAVLVPLFCALMAGLLMALFTAVLGGGATYKQVYAVVAHSLAIGVVQQLFSFPIMYMQGAMDSPTRLAVFFPGLEMGFLYYLLTALDLFYLWSTFNLSIGIAVLYRRSTGSVATILFGVYLVIALIIAAWRA